MGALHEGHLSLVRRSVAQCDVTFVTIFVNPTQFGPSEDFTRYPRTLEADLQMLAREQADVVYTPTAEQIYCRGSRRTWIRRRSLSPWKGAAGPATSVAWPRSS